LTAYHLLLVYPDQRTSPDRSRSSGWCQLATLECQLSALTIEKGVFLFSASLRLRQNAIFPRAFNVICAVQSSPQKYFAFAVGQIIFKTSRRPAPQEGRIAIVTDAGWDAVDAGSATDERAEFADGEVVWS
jgi:hypothetical protein